MELSKSSSKREADSNTSLPQETRNISNNLTLHYLKELEKEEQTKPKVGRKKEVKIWVKINKIENKKTMQNINITAGSWKRLN